MSYKDRKIDGVWHIWLINYGWAKAKPASEFKPGEYFRWNQGTCARFSRIAKETKQTITVVEEYFNGDEPATFERRLNKDRLVAIGDDYYFRSRGFPNGFKK